MSGQDKGLINSSFGGKILDIEINGDTESIRTTNDPFIFDGSSSTAEKKKNNFFVIQESEIK